VADNTTIYPASGGDVIRDKDRAGIKTQIVGLDLNPAGGSESLMSGKMPVTAADGDQASIGALADAESSSGSGSVIAVLKRLRTLLAGGLPSALTGSGNLKAAIVESTATVTVDSELPAAAALTDADANPTVPGVGAYGMVWESAGGVWHRVKGDASGRLVVIGDSAVNADAVSSPISTLSGRGFTYAYNNSNWDRLRTAPGATGTPGTGLLGAGLLLKGTTNYSDAQSAVVVADGATGIGVLADMPLLYNGTNFDRPRNNTEGTVLASASRAATPTISNITNYNARGIRLFLNITVTPNNAETLTVSIEWVDPVSAAVKAVTAFPAITASSLGASPAAGVREFVYELYPGALSRLRRSRTTRCRAARCRARSIRR
jgi:hypothetical protein